MKLARAALFFTAILYGQLAMPNTNSYSVSGLINAGATGTQNITIPNGIKIKLDRAVSWANGTFTCRIIWDATGASPVQVWGCSGNSDQPIEETFTGDGSKVLRLQVSNTGITQMSGGVRVFYSTQ